MSYACQGQPLGSFSNTTGDDLLGKLTCKCFEFKDPDDLRAFIQCIYFLLFIMPQTDALVLDAFGVLTYSAVFVVPLSHLIFVWNVLCTTSP